MSQKIINIYAPCDGTIKHISETNDELFSQKILGDGFCLIPKIQKKIKLKSVFEKSKVALLTETKHATYLETSDGLRCLIHVGLDSKYYDHNTFSQSLSIDQELKKDEELLNFNSELFVEKKLSLEIPIVFSSETITDFKLEIPKYFDVKAGDLIGKIVTEETKSEKLEQKNTDQKNKFYQTASSLINLVGKGNFESVANCMTRTRFYVKDKTKVDIESIEKLKLVKGTIWSGNELQIVIGGDAYKVKDAVISILSAEKDENSNSFEINNSANKIKKTFSQKFLSACNGIIVPLMPLLISTGLLSGLNSILANLGLIQGEIPENGFVTDMDLFSGIMFILGNTGLALLSIFFCYSTVKYLGGDMTMGILIGLTISSRYFMTMGGQTGEWSLFKIGNWNVSLKPYNNNLLPAIGAGVLYFYIDKFIKMWMPGVVDIIFRPFLAYITTIFGLFFIFGPILGILESAISISSIWFYEIPFGFGGLILGLIWQPIVFLGMGWPVWLAIDADYFANSSTAVLRGLPIMDAAALAMIGTLLAMAIKSKNRKEKSNIYGSVVPLVFGITEPAMYGVTSSKGRPFWISCIGAGVAGMLLSLFGVTRENIGGYGVLGALGHVNLTNLYLYFAFAFIGLIVNFVITWFFYSETNNRTKLLNSTNNKIISFLKNNESDKQKNYDSIKKDLDEYTKKITDNKDKQKVALENYYKLELINFKIDEITEKNQSVKTRDKILQKNLIKLSKLIEEQKKFTAILNSLLVDLSNSNKLIEKDFYRLIDQIDNENLKSKANEFKKMYFNSIYDLEIFIGNLKPKEIKLSKEEILNTKNKFRILFNI